MNDVRKEERMSSEYDVSIISRECIVLVVMCVDEMRDDEMR